MMIIQIIATILMYLWETSKDTIPIQKVATKLGIQPETLDTIVSEILIELENPNPAQLLAHAEQLVTRISPSEIIGLINALVILMKDNVFNKEQMAKLTDFIKSLKMSDENRQKVNDTLNTAWEKTKQLSNLAQQKGGETIQSLKEVTSEWMSKLTKRGTEKEEVKIK